MAYAEQSPGMRGGINEHASALAYEWRRLTRAATAVALLTAPAFFLILYDSNHLSLVGSLIITALAVVLFRGLVEVVVRKLIPWPSLYGADAGAQGGRPRRPPPLLVLALEVPPATVYALFAAAAARALPAAVRVRRRQRAVLQPLPGAADRSSRPTSSRSWRWSSCSCRCCS